MKALSVKQPFASLIIHGLKPLEIRSWTTSYRGPVLIVSGVKFHEAYPYELAGDYRHYCTYLMWDKDFTSYISKVDMFISGSEARIYRDSGIHYKRGGRIGIANLVNVRPMEPQDEAKSFCPYDPDLFAWEFSEPTPLPFLKIKGQLSLFNVPDELGNIEPC